MNRAGGPLPIDMTADGRGCDDDLELVERSASGDLTAFEELYRRHVGRIYPLCLRMCADPVLAEDLVQETFVSAWRKIGTFRGESAFSSWLHRVAVNVSLGHRRRRTRRLAREEEAANQVPHQVDPRSGWPGGTLDLERAVAALPDKAREIFVLHDVEGFRHREIAKLTGVAVGTSKAQLHRARRLLRKALSS